MKLIWWPWAAHSPSMTFDPMSIGDCLCYQLRAASILALATQSARYIIAMAQDRTPVETQISNSTAQRSKED